MAQKMHLVNLMCLVQSHLSCFDAYRSRDQFWREKEERIYKTVAKVHSFIIYMISSL